MESKRPRDASNRIVAEDLEAIFRRTPETWHSLRGQSVFLTGGTGWFGRWLIETIAYANRNLGSPTHVHVLSRDPNAFLASAPHLALDPCLTFVQGDIRTFPFPDAGFSHVIHAAATSAAETYRGETSQAKFDTIVDGTRRLLDFAARSNIGHFLYISSGVTYGTIRDKHCPNEESEAGPLSTDTEAALGLGKRTAETLCALQAESHRWNLSIARCFSFVGPFMPMDLHYAIGNFVRQSLWDESIVVEGDGTPMRSYLYAADLVNWLLTILCARHDKPAIYNVGSDSAISVRDLAYRVRDLLAPEKPVEIRGVRAYGVGNPARNWYIPDISKARRNLGLDVWTSLDDAICRCAAYASEYRPDAMQANRRLPHCEVNN